MHHSFPGKILSSLLIMAELGILSSSAAFAAEYPAKVDQLGYLPTSKKTAVLSYKATNVAGPLTGNVYIRGKSDGAIKATLQLTAWNGGAVHAQSGDVGAIADFTAFSTPGVYYISDASNNRLSADFVIGAAAYAKSLNSALKTYYYQRIGTNKPASVAGAEFTDANVSYMRYNQDPYATDSSNYEAMQSAKTKKDLSGGWMDAGDPNKYTSFAALTLVNLLDSYKRASWAYGDGVGIPESGNGAPDLIDEVKWEIDFLKRMQDGTGTGGFLARVGLFRNNKDASNDNARKIGDDTNPRYYVGECPFSTIAGASALASSAAVLSKTSGEFFIAKDLAVRASRAWDRHQVLVGKAGVYDAPCDATNVVLAGPNETADTDATGRRQQNEQFAVITASYLYEYYHLKDSAKALIFKNYIEEMVSDTTVSPAVNKPRYALELSRDQDLVRVALLNYSKLSTVAPAVRTAIQAKIRDNIAGAYPLVPDADLYRASLNDGDYVWSAAAAKHASVAAALLDYASLDDAVLGDVTLPNIAQELRTKAKNMASEHAHWVNGVNPLSLMMVTNMPAVDPSNTSPFDPATKFNMSVPNMYHTWFGGTSSTCTAPGNTSLCQVSPPAYLMPGPCNPNFPGRETCFNGGFYQRNFDPLQVTRTFLSVEPSIWVQTFYTNLMARISFGGEVIAPAAPTAITGTVSAYGLNVSWNNATDNSGIAPSYNVYMKSGVTSLQAASLTEDLLVASNVRTGRSGGVATGALLTTTGATIQGLNCGTTYAVAVQSVDASGNKSATILSRSVKTAACLATAPAAANTLAVTPLAGTADTQATLTWKGLPANNLSHYEVRVNGRALAQVKPVAGGTYTYKVSGLNCGVTNTFTVRSVHPDGVKVTDASTTPAAPAEACVASTIFKKDQLDYFWDDGAGWGVSGRAITNGGATLESVVSVGGGIGIRRVNVFSSELPIVAGAAATGVATNAATAKLVFDVTAVKANATAGTAVALVPIFYFVNSSTQADGDGYVHFDSAVTLTSGVSTTVSVPLQPGANLSVSNIGASLLRKIALHLPNDTATVRLSNVRIVH